MLAGCNHSDAYLVNDYQAHLDQIIAYEFGSPLGLRFVVLSVPLKDCAKLACDAAFDTALDSTTRVFAGRALLVTGDEVTLKNYAGLVMAERSTLPSRMVRDAMMELFPTRVCKSQIKVNPPEALHCDVDNILVCQPRAPIAKQQPGEVMTTVLNFHQELSESGERFRRIVCPLRLANVNPAYVSRAYLATTTQLQVPHANSEHPRLRL